MKREILLHIGTTKTGSTSIQSLLNANRRSLLSQHICYPATPYENRHILLATAFTSYPSMFNDTDNPLWQGIRPDLAIADYLASLQAEITSLPSDVAQIILSAEQFSMYQRKQADIERLRDFLAPHASTFKVIVYLRRQDEHFASLHSQFLRLGNVHQPNLDHLQPFHHDYDYADLVARWASVFGENAMVPRVFERSTKKPFDVLADFAAVCGIDMTGLDRGSSSERNQSMNLAGQETLGVLSKLMRSSTGKHAVSGPVWQRVSEAITAASPGKGWQPTQMAACNFVDRYAASNELVRARWFPEKASLFSCDFSRLPKEAPSVSTEEIKHAASSAFLYAVEEALKRELRLTLDKAQLAHKLGDAKLRRVLLAKAVRLDGKNAVYRLKLAECLADQDDANSALAQLKIAASLAPNTPGLRALRRRLTTNAPAMPNVEHGQATLKDA